MALKISSTTVVSDTYVLENISNTDVTTDATINNSIKNQGNVLRIYDSTGSEVRTIWGAQLTPNP